MILTNENTKQMKLYSLLQYIPVWSFICLATSSSFAVVFEVPAGLVIKNGELSHSLCQFFLQGRHFFLAISLKGPCNEFFEWMIIPIPIPIPFTLFSLDRKRRKRKRNRKKKKLFWSASDSASDSDFWFTLDRNAPCASDSDSASDCVASVNQPLREAEAEAS